MSFGAKLNRLRDPGAFPLLGPPAKRWGQLLREQPELSEELRRLSEADMVVPLASLARIHSGVVTRATAFFIVRELKFSEVPRRFGVTRKDYNRIAVVLDGVGSPFRIERDYLRPLIKGPDDLISPLKIRENDLRLFNVSYSKQELQTKGATGALAYLRRGETFDYKTSPDDLKGGIPSQRAQVRVRKPFWYSLGVPDRGRAPTIAVPEHYDQRYIATLLPEASEAVINDTLYSVTPYDSRHALDILISMNSLLGWYQTELRGRTQHGQGLLKVKIPDFGGMLVLNPLRLDVSVRKGLLSLFRRAVSIGSSNSLDALGNADRDELDRAVLAAAGFANPSETRNQLETELRGAIAERRERRLSVIEAKLDRRKTRGNASLDALATRIAAGCELFPDPRDFVGPGVAVDPVPLLSEVEGPLRVGTELFSQNEVYSGDVCVARLEDALSAFFVRGVLLHDPEVKQVDVPVKWARERIVTAWEQSCKEWRQRFEATAALALRNTPDIRSQRDAISKALSLLHAQ